MNSSKPKLYWIMLAIMVLAFVGVAATAEADDVGDYEVHCWNLLDSSERIVLGLAVRSEIGPVELKLNSSADRPEQEGLSYFSAMRRLFVG